MGRVRWDDGQVSPVHLSQPSQPNRVSPISTVRWAQQNGKPHHQGKELAGIEGIAVILLPLLGHGCAVLPDLQFLDSEEASGRPIL